MKHVSVTSLTCRLRITISDYTSKYVGGQMKRCRGKAEPLWPSGGGAGWSCHVGGAGERWRGWASGVFLRLKDLVLQTTRDLISFSLCASSFPAPLSLLFLSAFDALRPSSFSTVALLSCIYIRVIPIRSLPPIYYLGPFLFQPVREGGEELSGELLTSLRQNRK